MVKEYFANYFLHTSDVSFDIANNHMEVHESTTEPWHVTLVDTGEDTQTGGRLKRVRRYLDDDEEFCFTYGDGVSDIDMGQLIEFHRGQGVLATVTAVQPPPRFGVLEVEGERVRGFREKPQGDVGFINGGFFVLSPKVIEYIDGDQTVWEREPMERLAREGQLAPYIYEGFWYAMDVMRDKNHLDDLWRAGQAPWKTWS
jgi:glucose-1-phosphate cytidylyltransferase